MQSTASTHWLRTDILLLPLCVASRARSLFLMQCFFLVFFFLLCECFVGIPTCANITLHLHLHFISSLFFFFSLGFHLRARTIVRYDCDYGDECLFVNHNILAVFEAIRLLTLIIKNAWRGCQRTEQHEIK